MRNIPELCLPNQESTYYPAEPRVSSDTFSDDTHSNDPSVHVTRPAPAQVRKSRGRSSRYSVKESANTSDSELLLPKASNDSQTCLRTRDITTPKSRRTASAMDGRGRKGSEASKTTTRDERVKPHLHYSNMILGWLRKNRCQSPPPLEHLSNLRTLGHGRG